MATSKIQNIRSPKQYDVPKVPDTTTGRTVTISLPKVSRKGYLLIANGYAYSMIVINGSTLNLNSLTNADTYPDPSVTGSNYTYTINFDGTGVRNVTPFIIGEF